MTGRDNPEPNLITVGPETGPRGRAVLPVPSPTALPLGAPPSRVPRFVSTKRVSSDNPFLSVRQEPALGPPACNSLADVIVCQLLPLPVFASSSPISPDDGLFHFFRVQQLHHML